MGSVCAPQEPSTTSRFGLRDACCNEVRPVPELVLGHSVTVETASSLLTREMEESGNYFQDGTRDIQVLRQDAAKVEDSVSFGLEDSLQVRPPTEDLVERAITGTDLESEYSSDSAASDYSGGISTAAPTDRLSRPPSVPKLSFPLPPPPSARNKGTHRSHGGKKHSGTGKKSKRSHTQASTRQGADPL
uniref:Uncharacterized protein n=1 Tax=Alexandrium monilatum TaxID=311494 RepID=A0A6T1DRS2_9DINO